MFEAAQSARFRLLSDQESLEVVRGVNNGEVELAEQPTDRVRATVNRIQGLGVIVDDLRHVYMKKIPELRGIFIQETPSTSNSPVGFRMKVHVAPKEDGVAYWDGHWSKYKFTKRGLINKLAEWVKDTGGGKRTEFLEFIGKIKRVEPTSPGGRPTYEWPDGRGYLLRRYPDKGPVIRGYLSTFFAASVQAGVVSTGPGGLLLPGPNLEKFLSGNLVYGGEFIRHIEVMFLADDWIYVKSTNNNHLSLRWMCDGTLGLRDLISSLVEDSRLSIG